MENFILGVTLFTVIILALAYFIRLLPLGHRTITAGLVRVPAELEGASRDLEGAHRLVGEA